MTIGIIIALIIATIFFGIMIWEFWKLQAEGEITIYRNTYDLFFNAVVYILPAAVFFIEYPGFNNTVCYFSLCIGFSILMCVSAWDSNDSVFTKIVASIVKIITGIETILIIAVTLLLLLLLFSGMGNNKNRNYD